MIYQKRKMAKHSKKIDVVFHLAALADIVPSIQNPDKYFQSNVVATKNLVETCIKYKVKKLYIQPLHPVMEYQRNIQRQKMKN